MREDVADAARICARMGLVEAFGHVSARLPEGGFMITATRPLPGARAAEVLQLSDEGEIISGEAELLPLETPLHVAIYAARPDVGALCRTHSPHAVAWGARSAVPPLVIGLDGLSGEIALHDDTDLVVEIAAGAAAASSMGDADCLLIRANGNICSGGLLSEAVVRAWFLEQRAANAARIGDAAPLEGEQLARRSRHYDVELVRAWRWCRAQFGDGDQL